MKTYIELEEKQQEYENKFEKIKKENPKNTKELSICADWVDLIDEFLIWNVVEYAKKVGYDFESGEEIFEFTDEVKKEIVMNEEQARERCEILKKEVNSIMASERSSRHNLLLKNELDILEWMLE